MTDIEVAKFCQLVINAREKLASKLNRIPKEQVLQSLSPGEMSVKDMVAHITWYEIEMIGVLRERALRGSEWWSLGLDERNAKILALSREKTWEEVKQQFDQIYEKLSDLLMDLTDEELIDPSKFKEMPAEWLPCDVIASNTYEHYDQHSQDLERLLT